MLTIDDFTFPLPAKRLNHFPPINEIVQSVYSPLLGNGNIGAGDSSGSNATAIVYLGYGIGSYGSLKTTVSIIDVVYKESLISLPELEKLLFDHETEHEDEPDDEGKPVKRQHLLPNNLFQQIKATLIERKYPVTGVSPLYGKNKYFPLKDFLIGRVAPEDLKQRVVLAKPYCKKVVLMTLPGHPAPTNTLRRADNELINIHLESFPHDINSHCVVAAFVNALLYLAKRHGWG